MNTENWIKHIHDKSFNKDDGKNYSDSEQKEKYTDLLDTNAHSAGGHGNLKNENTLQDLEMIPKIIKEYKGSTHETNHTINSDIHTETPNPEENLRVTQEDTILKTRILATDDITNASQECFDDSKRMGQCNQSADLPLASEDMPMSECSDHNAFSAPLKKCQSVNQFADSADIKNCDQADDCGLLRYRKWWERTKADISINGKLITGIPIFIEDNILRVVNNNYSYFIPLEKVDYIRTTSGLSPCVSSSDEKLTK